jgi:hypothetical protein
MHQTSSGDPARKYPTLFSLETAKHISVFEINVFNAVFTKTANFGF